MTKGDLCNGHCTRGTVRRNKTFMRHYYEYTLRLFNDGRADDYLNELFLNAAKNGDYERVQNFLARTSRNTSVNVDAKDKNGFTAVMYATLNEHRKVVSLLLNYGADITLCNDRGQSVLDFAPDSMRPLLLGSVARQGYSSRHLLQAAWQGNLELVKKLLSSKTKSATLDVNCKNADGLTPLLLVTRDLNLFEKIEKVVLENGYHPAEVVRELLHHNADFGAKDSDGKRPLHFAAHGKGSHAIDVVDALIEKAASDIDTPDGFSNSPLHWATREDNQPILLALIRGGANVNVRGHIGKTPLHIAASHGYERASGTLLEHGADVTITDDHGQSPVDVAKGRRIQVVLKDAWAEQTKHNVPRWTFSAPVHSPIEQDSAKTKIKLTEQMGSEDSTVTRIGTAPMERSERKLKKRQPSQRSVEKFSLLDKRTSTAPLRRPMSDLGMPGIFSTSKADLIHGPRITSGLLSQEQHGQKQPASEVKDVQTSVALPSLSVLNIELRDLRNLRGKKQDLQITRRPSHLALPPQYRLHHRLSSPVLTYQRKISPPGTPDKDSRMRSASTGQDPSNRTALPSRVPPLPVRRVLSPELRSMPSLDVVQERISVTPTVVDLDLLTQKSVSNEIPFPVFPSEVREDTPSPRSPRGASRCSDTSQTDGKSDANQTQSSDGVDMTRTFTSIPRQTFWIPADKNGEETTEKSSDENRTEPSSHGTSFYIDLKDLEALAAGTCSLCRKPFPEGNPEGNPEGRRDSVESRPEKELCKSCQSRPRSNNGAFWIPFSDERKASPSQSPSKMEIEDSRTNGSKKSHDENLEQCKLQEPRNTRSNVGEEGKPANVIAEEASGSESVVLANLASALSTQSPSHLGAIPRSNMTGFNVSCTCDNDTGLCSCTISKNAVISSPAAKQSTVTNTDGRTSVNVNVVKTFGETSSGAESTLLTRTEKSYALSTTDLPSSSRSRPKKDGEMVMKSRSETGVYDCAAQEAKSAHVNSSVEESRGFNEKDSSISSARLLPASEALNNGRNNLASDPSPPKQAWSTPTPRSEETGAIGIRIINLFPSPEPPDNKSAVHPPVGALGDPKSANKKVTAGKKGRKGGTKSSGNTKNKKPRTKARGQEQNGKQAKKRAKKKEELKMITVQQREDGEDLGLRTISQGGFEMLEDVPVPPAQTMDDISTVRAFSTRMHMGKLPVLSPIPESPRSKASTPRAADASESIKDSNVEVQDRNVSRDTEVEAPRDEDIENCEGFISEGDFDVVDGGIIGRLKALGTCIPRLTWSGKNTDSDVGSDTECNEALIVYPQQQLSGPMGPGEILPLPSNRQGDTEGDQPKANTVSSADSYRYQQEVHDEADDAMEEIVRRELSLRAKGETHSGHASGDDFLANVTSRASSSEQVVESQQYSRDLSEFDVEAERGSLDSRTSSEMSSHLSDTDSSYNSCDLDSPRPVSSASSLNSSDTYISSARDSSYAVTSTPERDICSKTSVEMDYYDRMAREKSTISTSSSSDSSTTLAQAQSMTSRGSLGNISQGPMGSLAGVLSETVVRSRLSASSRSPCSSSCDEEIVWKKGNELGRGAFGTVWCGLTNTGELIAVKQVELNHSNWEEAEEQYEKLQEEVYLLKSLKHPNIVKFIGTCLDGGVVNIFMEFVPAGSIASILARFGCLGEPVFRRYTKQLLSGVSYLHGNNVIHRDIKGGNILITQNGVLKLIDFGCAKRLYINLSMSKSNILRSMKGTPYWMAPEVIRQTGHGRKSDIWSVGCTVFEMATAKPPWSDMPPMAAIFAIGSGTLAVPKLSEDFSESARDFVNTCLTRNPDLRPSADELLQHNFMKDLP